MTAAQSRLVEIEHDLEMIYREFGKPVCPQKDRWEIDDVLEAEKKGILLGQQSEMERILKYIQGLPKHQWLNATTGNSGIYYKIYEEDLEKVTQNAK